MDLNQAINDAVALHQAGKLEEAQAIYRRVLAEDPGHADALYLMGSLAYQTGRADEAIVLLEKAIAARPTAAAYHNNLGAVLASRGELEKACAAYRRAGELDPNLASAFQNLGASLVTLQRLPEALAAFQRACELAPDLPSLLSAANIAKELGRHEEAAAAIRRAIELQPRRPELYIELVSLLRLLGRLPEAETAVRQAIALDPNSHQALNILYMLLADMGRGQEALADAERALERLPGKAGPVVRKGVLLRRFRRSVESLECFKKALAIEPNNVQALRNYSALLTAAGQIEEAIQYCRRAVELSPQDALLHSQLNFISLYLPTITARDILRDVQEWNRRHGEPLRKFIQPHANSRDAARRLRVGYVSRDFKDHVVGWNLLPLLRNHDHQQFEIVCYSSRMGAEDHITEQLRASADQWRDVSLLDDFKLAELIRRDGIDILVDLAAHTARNRLQTFAMEPAPAQVTYLGYCGTTGVRAMHYRLSDPFFDPPEQDLSVYTEQTVRLPRTYWCYNPAQTPPALAAESQLASGIVTFGCMNRFHKVSTVVMETWARLLARAENTRLILHAPLGDHLQTALDIFRRHGVEATRIEFVGKKPWEDYMRVYNRIDIALDPFPFGGGITSLDCLQMSTPLITLFGETSVSRGGCSILCNVGLPELVARTTDEYVEIGAKLAADRERIAELKRTLRDRLEASPLRDAKGFARDIEAAYRRMWTNWCEAAPQ
jgi:predicted O-linked N-acetylglucosamine transferase (SPINDLY family)